MDWDSFVQGVENYRQQANAIGLIAGPVILVFMLIFYWLKDQTEPPKY